MTKEYYVNDYGNQIINFTKSVYLRIREKLYDEKFPLDNPDLYHGDYLKDIANNIIKNNKDINKLLLSTPVRKMVRKSIGMSEASFNNHITMLRKKENDNR